MATPKRQERRERFRSGDGIRRFSSAELLSRVTRTKGQGNCARDVGRHLQRFGMQVGWGEYDHAIRGDAYLWAGNLRARGWQIIDVDPNKAPEGAIVVTDRNPRGKRRGNGGAKFGHVEIVAKDDNGRRWFVSDYRSRKPGGSVPDNRQWVLIPPSNWRARYMPGGKSGTQVASAAPDRATVPRPRPDFDATRVASAGLVDTKLLSRAFSGSGQVLSFGLTRPRPSFLQRLLGADSKSDIKRLQIRLEEQGLYITSAKTDGYRDGLLGDWTKHGARLADDQTGSYARECIVECLKSGDLDEESVIRLQAGINKIRALNGEETIAVDGIAGKQTFGAISGFLSSVTNVASLGIHKAYTTAMQAFLPGSLTNSYQTASAGLYTPSYARQQSGQKLAA